MWKWVENKNIIMTRDFFGEKETTSTLGVNYAVRVNEQEIKKQVFQFQEGKNNKRTGTRRKNFLLRRKKDMEGFASSLFLVSSCYQFPLTIFPVMICLRTEGKARTIFNFFPFLYLNLCCSGHLVICWCIHACKENSCSVYFTLQSGLLLSSFFLVKNLIYSSVRVLPLLISILWLG